MEDRIGRVIASYIGLRQLLALPRRRPIGSHTRELRSECEVTRGARVDRICATVGEVYSRRFALFLLSERLQHEQAPCQK